MRKPAKGSQRTLPRETEQVACDDNTILMSKRNCHTTVAFAYRGWEALGELTPYHNADDHVPMKKVRTHLLTNKSLNFINNIFLELFVYKRTCNTTKVGVGTSV